MKAIINFIRNNPVVSYFILTFTISWGGVYILGSPYGMPTSSEQFQKVWPIVFIPYFLGPSLSGLIMTGIVYGKQGFRELLSRMLKWKVGLGWYALALLTMPLLTMPLQFLLSLISPIFISDIFTTANKLGLILLGLGVGLFFGGFLEELGWTGFAIPSLRRSNFSILNTGLIVGFLWGVWHLFPTYWASGDANGGFSPLLFLPPSIFYMGVLTGFRVLMVWAFDRTGSQFLLMLMHMSATASTLFIFAPAARGIDLMIYYIILTAIMWAVAAAVVIYKKRSANEINH